MDGPSKLTFGVCATGFAALFLLHRDLGITLGNSEWDYVANVVNGGQGLLERTGSLREALRPHGLYGPGYSLAIWAVRGTVAVAGVPLDPFRAAQLVTFGFSLALVWAAWALGRCLGLRSDLSWLPVAGMACTWTFLNLSVQVTTDVPAASLTALAMIPLLGPRHPAGAVLAGALLGLAFSFRLSAAAAGPVFCAAAAAGAWRFPWRDRALVALQIAVGFLAGGALRLAADCLQTGSLVYYDRRAVATLDVHGALGRYLYYEGLLAPALLALGLVHARAAGLRHATRAALVLVLGMPLGLAVVPVQAARYVLALFPLAIAGCAAALEGMLPPRLRVFARGALAGVLAVVFLLELELLADKYRIDLPEREIADALEPGSGPRPTVLIRSGVPEDQSLHQAAIRYRLRRVRAAFAATSGPITASEIQKRGFAAPLFILRIPIQDTGPSVVLDGLRGRARQVFRPDPDPVLRTPLARRVVYDPVSGVELHRVDGL